MLIALFPNSIKDGSEDLARKIIVYLKDKGVNCIAEDEKADRIGASPLSSQSIEAIDFALSIGGDGTILRLVHNYPNLTAPILGINYGSLGFMADVPVQDTFSALDKLLSGKFSIQNRLVIEGESQSFAVNDIVLHRASNPSLVELAVSVDGSYLNTFSADGLIISTPSGSTAYSMAAGGPILAPDLKALVITPICPHTISNRPIVFMPQQSIEITYKSDLTPVEVTYDGFNRYKLHYGKTLRIDVSNRYFRLVHLDDHDYFLTLRTKLGWTGKLKNSSYIK